MVCRAAIEATILIQLVVALQGSPALLLMRHLFVPMCGRAESVLLSLSCLHCAIPFACILRASAAPRLLSYVSAKLMGSCPACDHARITYSKPYTLG